MTQITKHPLYKAADAVKGAFMLNGFVLIDDSYSEEILCAEKNTAPFNYSEEHRLDTIALQNSYVLRTNMVTENLNLFKGSLPLKKIVAGKVYGAKEEYRPDRTRVEGIYADASLSLKDMEYFFSSVFARVFGIGAKAKLELKAMDSYSIELVREGKDNVSVGTCGAAGWTVKSILALDNCSVWVFSIDVDDAALALGYAKTREELYSNDYEYLASCKDEAPYVGESFANKAADILRSMGYSQYTGDRLYDAACYKRMNMFQDEWDANNNGIKLCEALGDKVWLPTVLTPAGEDALALNWALGRKEARLFDIEHIFLPGKNGNAPVEKIALSVKVYSEDMDSLKFRGEIAKLLETLGISNHFAFSTNAAIAYDQKDTWLLLDEKLSYMDGNYGGISPIALENHKMGTKAFMANLELAALEKKAAEEYQFTAPELL